MHKRKRLPIRWIKLLFKRQNGKCAVAKCNAPLIGIGRGIPKNWVDEHLVPLALGGTNALKNRELRCLAHAKSKTFGSKATTAGSDIGNIAKVRRIRKGKMQVQRSEYIPGPTREEVQTFIAKQWRKLRGRPFSKVQRPMRRAKL